ncbi:DUF4189 domain-containing protein [Mycobacterium lacus]|nr:DUF4189 domain-containing protein [Mycobacterium lacus]
MATELRRRVALAGASRGAAAAMTVTLVEPARASALPIPPIAHYGAIAYAPNGAAGKAWRHRTRAQAENNALRLCGVANWPLART